MILNIKYFGVLAEITKKKEEQLVLEGSNMTVNSLKLKMESAYQELQKQLFHCHKSGDGRDRYNHKGSGCNSFSATFRRRVIFKSKIKIQKSKDESQKTKKKNK